MFDIKYNPQGSKIYTYTQLCETIDLVIDEKKKETEYLKAHK